MSDLLFRIFCGEFGVCLLAGIESVQFREIAVNLFAAQAAGTSFFDTGDSGCLDGRERIVHKRVDKTVSEPGFTTCQAPDERTVARVVFSDARLPAR